MNMNQQTVHTYPMTKHWQLVNIVGGFWSWLCLLGHIVVFPFLLFLNWERKVFPAFFHMMAGPPRSFLRISKNGLVYRNWPWFAMRCRWEDVKRIHYGRFFGDALYLERADQIGIPEFSINLNQPQIHLSSLAGWKEGKLLDALRHFAPGLF